MRIIPLSGSIVTTALMLTAVLLTGERALAQRGGGGGFSAEMMMDRLDQNDDGRLDQDEISESRFPIGDMAERAGIDTSRGLDADDVERLFENMRQQGGGFGGGPGGFGPGGFGDSGGDRGGRGGDRGGDRGGRGGFDREGSDRGDRGDRSSRTTKAPEPPPRVTVDLQASYVAGDTNGDGQIELSEWLRWKSRAALADFISLDRNTDGILTPRELALADNALPADLARFFPGANPAALQLAGTSSPPTNPTMTGTAPPAATPTTAAVTPAETPPAEASSADLARHKATAANLFKILDRDRDGTIGDLEWRRSSRLRPKFEAAGADLTQPMSVEQFTDFYVKFSSAS